MTLIPELGIDVPSTWNVETLERVTSKIGSGATPRGGSSVYVESGPALIRSQNIYDHQFKTDGLVFLSSEAAAALRGVTVEKNDVLINITGDSILRVTTVPETILPARVNQHVAIVRSNGKVDPGYLQKWLSLPLMKDFMMGYSAGGTRKAVTKGHLQSFPIPIPPIPEQRAIAATLGTLDDKIESNRRAVGKVQELGDTLFTSAVDERRVISEIATITMGTSPKGDTLNEVGDGVDFYQGTRDFGFRFPSQRIWTTNPIRLARRNDTLMSVRAPVGELNRAVRDCCVGRGVAAIHSEKQPSTLYYAMRASRAAWDKFQGDGTVFASVNKQDVHDTEINWVADDRAERLEQELSSLDSKIESLERESGRLISLRDTLLPALLSGSIRVPFEGAET